VATDLDLEVTEATAAKDLSVSVFEFEDQEGAIAAEFLLLGIDPYPRKEGAVVTAPKSAMGHLLGAAGAVEAIATLLAIRDGVVPPTLNLDNIDPAVQLDVATEARKVELTAAVNDSFGFGGHNVALAFTAV